MSNEFSLPGGEALAVQKAREVLRAAGRLGRTVDELHDRLVDLPAERLEALLASLEGEGQAVEWSGRWFHPEATDWKVARVQAIEGEDLLLAPIGEREPAWFARRRRARGAREGDRVLLEPASLDGRRRRTDLEEAVVVRVLARGFTRLVGTLEIDEQGRRWLLPFDPQLALEVEVMGAEDLLEDPYVVVAIEGGGEGRRHPRGRVVEVLGNLEKPGVDTAVIVRHYELPEAFPPEVLRQAAALPADPRAEDRAGREDRSAGTVVTIDGETARDFDDGVSVEALAGGGCRLGVHIADVAHYVREGSILDREAYYRGTSVYFPDRVLPMLPEALSNELCSLKPDRPRLAVSVFLDVAPDGSVLGRRFAETVIQSARRLTYGEVRRLLEEPAPGDREEYGETLLVSLRALARLAAALRAKRRERGSLDFDLPAGDVILDTDGNTVGIRPGERTVAHRLIEELMIAANEAVAEELLQQQIPALYRVHDGPREKDLLEVREILAGFGLRLQGDLGDLPPSALQEVLRSVEGRPEEGFVSAVVLRTLARALYSPESRGHYALAATHYCHFTSPIRRYPDLVVHRALKGRIAGRQAAGDGSLAARMPGVGEHASTTERRAEGAERDLLQWKKVRFLASRVGETFQGRITGVAPFGLFVQLDGLYVDGLVPIRTLGDDYYVFEPDAHRLVGEGKGRVFRLADAVEVELTGVNTRHRGLELRLAHLPEAPRRKEPSRRRSGQKGRRRRRP